EADGRGGQEEVTSSPLSRGRPGGETEAERHRGGGDAIKRSWPGPAGAAPLCVSFAPPPLPRRPGGAAGRSLRAPCAGEGVARDRVSECESLCLFPGARVFRYSLPEAPKARLLERHAVLVVTPGGAVTDLRVMRLHEEDACVAEILAAMRRAGAKVRSKQD